MFESRIKVVFFFYYTVLIVLHVSRIGTLLVFSLIIWSLPLHAKKQIHDNLTFTVASQILSSSLITPFSVGVDPIFPFFSIVSISNSITLIFLLYKQKKKKMKEIVSILKGPTINIHVVFF